MKLTNYTLSIMFRGEGNVVFSKTKEEKLLWNGQMNGDSMVHHGHGPYRSWTVRIYPLPTTFFKLWSFKDIKWINSLKNTGKTSSYKCILIVFKVHYKTFLKSSNIVLIRCSMMKFQFIPSDSIIRSVRQHHIILLSSELNTAASLNDYYTLERWLN